jgi:hypothetical protein
VDQRACQDVICGESAVAEGRTVLFRDLTVKQNERIEADQVCFVYSFMLVKYTWLFASSCLLFIEVSYLDSTCQDNELLVLQAAVGGNLHEAKKVETGMILQAALKGGTILQAAPEGGTILQAALEGGTILQAAPEGGTILQAAPDGKLLEPLKASNSGIASCVKASTGKYEIHLNVSNLSGCYFNFGPGSNSSAFPVAKTS